MQRDKESVAAMMREKQKAGKGPPFLDQGTIGCGWCGMKKI